MIVTLVSTFTFVESIHKCGEDRRLWSQLTLQQQLQLLWRIAKQILVDGKHACLIVSLKSGPLQE